MAESSDNNNDDDSTTSFKHLSFDRKVIELVEELRLRRNLENEGENTLRSVLNEKYQEELRWDEQQRRHAREKENLEQQLELANRKLEDKVCVSDDDKTKQHLMNRTYSHEIRMLKEDLRVSKSEKLNLQKKIQELEGKLNLHNNYQESLMTQVSDARKKMTDIHEDSKKLTESQRKVMENVASAQLMFKKYDLTNIHLQQAFNVLNKKSETLKKDLISSRTELITLKQSVPIQPEKSKNDHLVIELQEKVLNLDNLLLSSHKENEKCLNNLLESNKLLNKIMDQYYENHEQMKNITKELEFVQDKLVKTQEELQEKEGRINKMEEMATLKEKERTENQHSVGIQTDNTSLALKKRSSSCEEIAFSGDTVRGACMSFAPTEIHNNFIEDIQNGLMDLQKNAVMMQSETYVKRGIKDFCVDQIISGGKRTAVSEILKRKLEVMETGDPLGLLSVKRRFAENSTSPLVSTESEINGIKEVMEIDADLSSKAIANGIMETDGVVSSTVPGIESGRERNTHNAMNTSSNTVGFESRNKIDTNDGQKQVKHGITDALSNEVGSEDKRNSIMQDVMDTSSNAVDTEVGKRGILEPASSCEVGTEVGKQNIMQLESSNELDANDEIMRTMQSAVCHTAFGNAIHSKNGNKEVLQNTMDTSSDAVDNNDEIRKRMQSAVLTASRNANGSGDRKQEVLQNTMAPLSYAIRTNVGIKEVMQSSVHVVGDNAIYKDETNRQDTKEMAMQMKKIVNAMDTSNNVVDTVDSRKIVTQSIIGTSTKAIGIKDCTNGIITNAIDVSSNEVGIQDEKKGVIQSVMTAITKALGLEEGRNGGMQNKMGTSSNAIGTEHERKGFMQSSVLITSSAVDAENGKNGIMTTLKDASCNVVNTGDGRMDAMQNTMGGSNKVVGIADVRKGGMQSSESIAHDTVCTENGKSGIISVMEGSNNAVEFEDGKKEVNKDEKNAGMVNIMDVLNNGLDIENGRKGTAQHILGVSSNAVENGIIDNAGHVPDTENKKNEDIVNLQNVRETSSNVDTEYQKKRVVPNVVDASNITVGIKNEITPVEDELHTSGKAVAPLCSDVNPIAAKITGLMGMSEN